MEKVKNFFSTIASVLKTHIKLVVIVIALIVIAVVVAVVFTGGGPKKAVESYISAMDNADSKAFIEAMDFKGAMAWENCEEDEEKFVDEYEDIDEDDDDLKEQFEQAEETMADLIDTIDDHYEEYSVKIKEFKETEKLADGLYKVKAQIETKTKSKDEDDEDENTNTNTSTFIVYNDKIIDMEN